MPIVDARINDMMTSIKNQLLSVYPISDTYASAVDWLGSGTSNLTPSVSNGSLDAIDITWGTVANQKVKTTNSPDVVPSTAFNFDIKIMDAVRCLAIVNATTVKGIMELPTAVFTDTYGGPLFLDFIEIEIVEV